VVERLPDLSGREKKLPPPIWTVMRHQNALRQLLLVVLEPAARWRIGPGPPRTRLPKDPAEHLPVIAARIAPPPSTQAAQSLSTAHALDKDVLPRSLVA